MKGQNSVSAPPAGQDSNSLYGDGYYLGELHRGHWFRDNARKHELRWKSIVRMLVPLAGDVVVDLGSAAGTQAIRLAPLVGRVIGVDSSPAAVAIARQRSRGIDNVEFVQADATRLDWLGDESVDKAMAIDFIEHIDDVDLRRMLDSVWRVLRPGGRLAIYTPCRTHYVERLKARGIVLKQIPGHIAVRTPEQIVRHLAGRAWQVADSFFLPSTYPVFGLFDRVLAGMPGLGGLFRFRYCLALVKVRAMR
jgi:SAM-dependent methyltransferase